MPERVSQELLDLLSELLAVERDGMRIYAGFLGDSPEELRPKLIEYAEQSRRSVLVLEKAIADLGGDVGHVSPGAEATTRLTEAVLSVTERFPARRWMYRMLHVLAYETRDQLVWQTLDAVAHEEKGEAGEILRRAADAVLTDEALGAHMQDRNEERQAWARDAIRLSLSRELGLPDPRSRKGRSFGRR